MVFSSSARNIAGAFLHRHHGWVGAQTIGARHTRGGWPRGMARHLDGHVSIRRVSLILDAVQPIANLEAAVGGDDYNFTEALLARGPAMVIEPKHERFLRLKALQAALARAADEVMPPAELQQSHKLVLGGMDDVLQRGMNSDPPATVSPQGRGGSLRHELQRPSSASTCQRSASGCQCRWSCWRKGGWSIAIRRRYVRVLPWRYQKGASVPAGARLPGGQPGTGRGAVAAARRGARGDVGLGRELLRDAEGEEEFTMGHRGAVATLQVVHPDCVWNSMDADVGSFCYAVQVQTARRAF